jgi:hypothetical protein
MHNFPFVYRLATLLAGVFLIATGLFSWLYARANAETQRLLEIEAAKSMLQLVSVAVIGGLLALILRVYEERRKAWVARRDLLRTDLSDQLRATYSRCKLARRQIRVAIDPTNGCIEYEKYSELLDELSDTQLTIERLMHAAEGGTRQGLVPESVAQHLKSMERYLGALVTEYESITQRKNAAVTVAAMPKLSDFAAKAVESNYKLMFGLPYRSASLAIEQAIEADLRIR